MYFFFSALIAYLLGSVSCAIIGTKLFNLPDPREGGSKNAGATNVLRISGSKQAAIYILLGDGLKGLIAVLIGRAFGQHGVALGFIALIVVIGHVYPIYFKFKGGKGVSTMVGAILGLTFWVAILMIITWAVFAFFFRYASLASIVTAISAPIYMLILNDWYFVFPTFLITVLLIWTHWGNIDRLRKGAEDKIQF